MDPHAAPIDVPLTPAPPAQPRAPRSAAPVATLAWRQLLRDLRAGELRLLLVAVTLAVAALAAVGFFADRLNGGLSRNARELLGGDAIVNSDQPTPRVLLDEARAAGFDTATSASFPSMARASDEQGGATRLVSVKAVSARYPLRGRLRLTQGAGTPEVDASGPPPRGSVWVEPPLLTALDLRVGDPLLLGDATLRIAGAIAAEPDRGAGFMLFAPRVLLNDADLAATGLIQPASRVVYRLAVASDDDAAVRRFVARAESRIQSERLRGVRVESLESGRPEMKQALDRAQKFLNLVALLSALLAAVAVAIASRDFASRHLDACAMLRVLGQSQRRIALQYLVEFACVGVAASAAGVAIGWALHHAFVWLLADLVGARLPPPSAWPALFGLGVGLTLLAGFGLPPVLQLARVPPVRVIRRDVGALKPASIAVLAGGVGGFAALLVAVASDLKLGLIAVGGFAGAVVVFAALSALAVAVLRRAVPESRAPRWLVLATRQVAARPAFAVLQIASLAVGLLALVLLVLLRTDLIASWRQATPRDAPNRFVVNVQPDQSEAFQARLREAGVERYDWYPMFRGRLVAVNGRPVSPDEIEGERGKRLVEREFNLSHAAAMPGHNEPAGGRWLADEPDAVSVEEGIAQTLGLKLGDRLRFDVAGQPAEGRITSLRRVDWGSMRVNFFVMFPTARMDSVPITYIAAYRAPPVAGFDNALARAFPNITHIDVSASIAEVQRVLDQVIRAVEFLFVFTLAAGLAVLFAAVSATREARAREYAVMRALGASGRLLGQMQRAELLGVGALAGLLATLAAIAVGWALARYVFDFAWRPQSWVPPAGAACGALLALAAGWWGLRDVLRRPVVQTLREAS